MPDDKPGPRRKRRAAIAVVTILFVIIIVTFFGRNLQHAEEGEDLQENPAPTAGEG
jgi:hypothetical protein